jgi:PAS domain S-box-containing protein
MAVFGSAEYGVLRWIIFPSFLALEREEAGEDLERCVRALNREIYHLDSFTNDWATWDDTYRFMQDRDPIYIESNLVDQTFVDNRLNLIYIITPKGEIVWGQSRGGKEFQPIELPPFSSKALNPEHPLLRYTGPDSSVAGIMRTVLGPALVASRPILTSDRRGPMRGYLIMGRFLDDELVLSLVEQTQVDLQILPPQPGMLPAADLPNGFQFEESPTQLDVATAVADIAGDPALLVKARIPRHIARKGSQTIRFAVIFNAATGIVLLVVLIAFLQRHMIRPLMALTRHAVAIRDSKDLSLRLDSRRRDEFGLLAQEFDRMVGQLLYINQTLEKQVADRTAELTAANERLREQIAERRRAEEKSRESEAKTRALLDAIPDVVFRLDRQGTLLECKGAQENLYLPREAFLGKRITDVLHTALPTRIMARLEEALHSRKLQVFEYELEIKGEPKHFECRMVAIGEDQAMAIIRDMTEKIRLEEQLRRAQKMEAVGTLAGGIAHDLNNVLSGLVSYPDLLLLDLPPNSPLRDPILTIKNSGEKAANIVQDLLTLARRGVSVSEVINLNTIITEYFKSPEFAKLRGYHPALELDLKLETDLLNIHGSAHHLSKTVMNLVSNAAEALPEGGRIRIRTENRYIDKPIAGYDDIKAGDFVLLEVSDNGVGISPEDIKHIFEPFYTKKVMERSGTGLGMAVVWGTVKDHSGYIDVQSEIGKGTRISIYLPASRELVSKLVPPVSWEQYRGRGETILVVDDMPEQLEIASNILVKLGYRVTTASSGHEAVNHLKRDPADLVILDMIMDPGMDGLETYQEILKIRPGQKAIIASGFSETERVRQAAALGVGAYIKKPYLLKSIGVAVRSELDRLTS